MTAAAESVYKDGDGNEYCEDFFSSLDLSSLELDLSRDLVLTEEPDFISALSPEDIFSTSEGVVAAIDILDRATADAVPSTDSDSIDYPREWAEWAALPLDGTTIETPHLESSPSGDGLSSSLDLSMLDSLPPHREIFGPPVGVRHPEHGLESPTAHGNLRLVLHAAGKRIVYGQGAGVDGFEVDGIDGAPPPGVTEMLAIQVAEVNGEKTKEKPKARVKEGECFLDAQIRPRPMALGVEDCPTEGNTVEVGINFWRLEDQPNRFHVVIGAAKKQQDERIDVGIRRTASWQFRYTQVDEASGKVIFDWIIPGTFIIRTGCSEVEDRKKMTKNMENERKSALINLLRDHGHEAEAAALSKRGEGNRKRTLGEILTCANGLGFSPEALATTIGGTHPEQYVCTLMRRWASRAARHESTKTVTKKRASAVVPSEDKPEDKSKKKRKVR